MFDLRWVNFWKSPKMPQARLLSSDCPYKSRTLLSKFDRGSSAAAVHEKRSVVHVLLAVPEKIGLLFFLFLFFISMQFIDCLRKNKILVALRRSQCLEQKGSGFDCSCSLSVGSSEKSRSPGTSGSRNANRCYPSLLWNEPTCVLTSGKPEAPPLITMWRRRPKYAKTIFENEVVVGRCRMVRSWSMVTQTTWAEVGPLPLEQYVAVADHDCWRSRLAMRGCTDSRWIVLIRIFRSACTLHSC